MSENPWREQGLTPRYVVDPRGHGGGLRRRLAGLNTTRGI